MIRFLKILLTGLLTSFFIFPFNLPLAIEINTKMILAAFGLVIFVMDRILGKEFRVTNDFLWLSLLAIGLSIWARLSMGYNHTNDGTYASYFISLWVWLGGAYAIVWVIRQVHGEVNVEIIGNYLIGVCTFQCILAYSMTLFPPLDDFINSLMGDADAYMGVSGARMHGLGAALDPSGLRFAAVLIIDAALFLQARKENNGKKAIQYILAFIIISVIGNMIARSTTLGIVLAIGYVLVSYMTHLDGEINLKFITVTVILLLAGIYTAVRLYRSNAEFQSHLRFAFEGFFSLAEKGEWEVRSNEILKNMVVWPETMKTWIIGDGYCENPSKDPNFLGTIQGGYYMGTDIGYLRFIFYFGLPGMLMMAGVFIKVASTCMRNLRGYEWLFLFMLLSNLTGWFKVTSDILMIFAPFLILAFLKEEETADEKLIPATENA